jgi:hypothetical protein
MLGLASEVAAEHLHGMRVFQHLPQCGKRRGVAALGALQKLL